MTFPAIQNWKVINNGETEPLGSFSTSSSGELAYVVLPLLIVGTYTTDRARLRLYYDSGFTRSFADSDWVRVTDLSTSAPVRLRARFDFSNEQLQSGVTYHAALVTENYTRNGDTKYLAVGLNSPALSSGSGSGTGAAVEVYHKRVTSY